MTNLTIKGMKSGGYTMTGNDSLSKPFEAAFSTAEDLIVGLADLLAVEATVATVRHEPDDTPDMYGWIEYDHVRMKTPELVRSQKIQFLYKDGKVSDADGLDARDVPWSLVAAYRFMTNEGN